MRKALIGLMLMIAVAGTAAADGLEKGDHEASLRASYSDTDFGSSEGLDLGSTEQTELVLTYGWMVTDRHEFGFTFGYIRDKFDGGEVFESSSVDGTSLGGFYAFNFGGSETVTPYVAAVLAVLEGDLGDTYDMEMGAEVGIKIYPFEHAGLSIGAGWSKLQSDVEGLDDADTVSIGAGLLIKY